jgi:hypothetical protein
MSGVDVSSDTSSQMPEAETVQMKVEVVILPVSELQRRPSITTPTRRPPRNTAA